jgi:type I restriction enzyme S subunit
MSGSWPVMPIGDLFEIGAGKSVTPASRGAGNRYPFLRTSNVLWGRIDVTTVDSMPFSDEEISIRSLRRGDLLVCEGGDIGRSAVWRDELAQCGFQNHLHRLRPLSADVVPEFFMYYLQAGFTKLGIYEGAGNKTTIPNLSRSRLAMLAAPRPPRQEQSLIAGILGTAQHAVEFEETLIFATRELKHAAMLRLFTCGTRGEGAYETEIGAVPESWRVVPLGTVREFLQYGTSSKCDYAGGTPVLRIPNVLDGRIDTSDVKACHLSAKEVNSWLLEAGDVLFIRTNGVRERVGRTAVYNGEPSDALFASYLIRARTQADKLLPGFLQYFTDTDAGVAQLGGQASPAADGKFNINTKTIDGLLVPLPNVDEQASIVSSLGAIDDKIAVHVKKLAVLKELFDTLLHDLMSARIRVGDLDVSALDAAAA